MVDKIEDRPTLDEASSMFEEEWSANGGGDLFEGFQSIVDFNASQDDAHRSNSDFQPPSPSFNPTNAPHSPTDDINNDQIQHIAADSIERASLIESEDNLNRFSCSRDTPTPFDYHSEQNRDLYFEQSAPSPARNTAYYDMNPALQPNGLLPYLHPSIETPSSLSQQPPIQLLPDYYHRPRRSVSEPPAGPPSSIFDDGQHSPFPEHRIVSRRTGQPIGMAPPLPEGLMRLKPLPKNRRRRTPDTEPTQMRDLPRTRRKRQDQKRGRTRRSEGPTSVPASPRHLDHFSETDELAAMPDVHQPFETHQMSPLQFVSTRICTPTPSPARFRSPMSGGIGSPRSIADLEDSREESKSSVSIPVSIEVLQTMITEAVQKAVKESKSEDGSAAVVQSFENWHTW